jgi:phosphohistidine phosphatase
MKLYFLRHTEALDGPDDAARPLSPGGKNDARELGRFLKRAGVEFDAAWSSPLIRAKQTAEIVLAACGQATLEIEKALSNEAAQSDFDRWLKGLPALKRVLLVGHAPSLPERVRRLLGLTIPETFTMPKGGLACLETEDRLSAGLKFFITPKAIGLRDR